MKIMKVIVGWALFYSPVVFSNQVCTASYFDVPQIRKIDKREGYKEILSRKDYVNKTVSVREFENAKCVRYKIFGNILSEYINMCQYIFYSGGDIIMGYSIPPGNTLLSLMQPSPILRQSTVNEAVANVARTLAAVHKIGFNEKFLTSDLVHKQLFLPNSIYCTKDKIIFHNTERMAQGIVTEDIIDLFNKYFYFKIGSNRDNFIKNYVEALLGYNDFLATVTDNDSKENSALIELETSVTNMKARINDITMGRKQYQCSIDPSYEPTSSTSSENSETPSDSNANK